MIAIRKTIEPPAGRLVALLAFDNRLVRDRKITVAIVLIVDHSMIPWSNCQGEGQNMGHFSVQ